MFLYELALQLGVRSTDLVERARSLGMNVGPSTFLAPAQVTALRDGSSAPGADAVDGHGPASVTALEPVLAGSPFPTGSFAPPAAVAVGGPEATAGVPVGAQLPPTSSGSWQATLGSPFATPSTAPLGPDGAPASGLPGDLTTPPRSMGIAAAIIAIVVLAAGTCFYLFQQTQQDDGAVDSSSSAVPAAGEARGTAEGGTTDNSAGGLDLGEDEISDPEGLCRINEDFEATLEALQPGDTSSFAGARSMILRSAPTTLEHLGRMREVTTGEMRNDVDSMIALTREAQETFEALPASGDEVTSSQQAAMRDLEARLDDAGRRLSAAVDRCP